MALQQSATQALCAPSSAAHSCGTPPSTSAAGASGGGVAGGTKNPKAVLGVHYAMMDALAQEAREPDARRLLLLGAGCSEAGDARLKRSRCAPRATRAPSDARDGEDARANDGRSINPTRRD